MLVALCVIPLDVIEAGRVFERRLRPIQPPHPSVQSWKSGAYVFYIEFEMLSVDRIEANECREQADISLGDVSTKEVGPCTGQFAQVRICLCEGGEDVECSGLI